LRFKSNQDEHKWQKAIEEHQEMIDALKARDTQRMRAVMQSHVMNKRDVVLALLDTENFSIAQQS